MLDRFRFGHIILFLTGLAVLTSSMLLLALTSVPVWVAILTPFALLFLFLLTLRPDYGYYLIIFLIPLSAWQGLLQQYKFLTLSKMLGIWVVLVSIFLIIRNPKVLNRLRSTLWYPLAFFLLAVIVSSLLSQELSAETLTYTRRLLVAYTFTALTLIFVGKRELQFTIPILLIASTGLASLTATLGNTFNFQSVMIAVNAENITARVVGSSSNPNFFAASIIISLPLIAYYIFTCNSWRWKIPLSVLFLNNCYAVFISYSRSQILVMIIVLCLLCVEYLRRVRPKHMGFVLMVALIFFAVGIYKAPQTDVWKRIATLTQPTADRSLQRRASYYIVAMESLKNDFFLGVGPGNYTSLYEGSIFSSAFSEGSGEFARSAHNTFLEVLTETGVLGAGCFLWALGLGLWTIYDTSRSRAAPLDKDLIRSVGYSMVAFMLSMSFFSNIQHKYIWLFVGLVMVMRRVSLDSRNQKIEALSSKQA